ncbi:MAG: GNAT family N-acetyltransferase [Microbacterium sp.]|uniref:GNAT family N-acetyltransferase n=1 Tax=Microbacterium sp. TaxID=51671 RepID=UPI001DD69810|nr:GNAT family N-acetyltransferase [Microbacterium sp.]MBW8763334.1 GNAT family N-acetyltransferase [Microbacterium sp.]
MWSIETLDSSQHDREPFDCGVADLNEWLKRQANQSGKKGSTLTRVLLKDGDSRVYGYYAQTAYSLVGEELARAFSVPQKYPIPCVLLARLACCESVRGQHLGEMLLLHALRSCVRVSEDIGVQFVVVHAIDDSAARFYEKYGFERFVDHPNHLLISLKEVRKVFST